MNRRTAPLVDLWDDEAASRMSPQERLRYRSNLLGSDKRITNFGGGNTSAKLPMKDPLTGETVQVMWVKGSGGDLGSMGLDGFATLYMDKLEGLKRLYRGPDHEDEMVGLFNHCTFDLNPRAASIDTPLHAFLPYAQADHTHPDAVIAIAATRRSKELTQEIWGGEIGWLPWRRPGFELGLELGRLAQENPNLVGCLLESHGLFVWHHDDRECYRLTLRIIQQAQDWLDENVAGPVFGGMKVPALPPEERRRRALALLPRIRGRVGAEEAKVGHFDDQEAVLEFVGGQQLEPLAALGTSCPDHFLRTKIRPLIVPADADDATLDRLAEAYRQDYAAYYDRARHADSPRMRDPNAVIHLVPGVGMLSFAKDKATARIASEFYVNAINVMRGAQGVDTYFGLPEQEAFDIEYWLLEEAKLQRMPKAKSLAGKIALVTGGGGGIGRATARRLMGEGACVMLTDISADALAEAEGELKKTHGADRVASFAGDVTREEDVVACLAETVLRFGGIDILVANAGIASASSIAETTLADWERNSDVLAKGVFLFAREAFKVMQAQKLGGSIVTIGSKNALSASAGASAYCAAKAAALHFTRCVALEGAPLGIRANVVNPDAVLRGSRIWQGDWKKARAASYGVDESGLEEVYRKRSMLQRSVYPEDIAEGVYFFASELSAKSTGNVLNVDAGNLVAFSR